MGAPRAEKPKTTDRRRRGRPAKDPAARRVVARTVWLTRADNARIVEAARVARESVSSFLAEAGRARAGGAPAGQPAKAPRREKAALRRQALGQIGRNLNQLVRAVNTIRLQAAHDEATDDDVVAVLAAYRQRFEELSIALLKEMAR